jgi:hypothetical protein
MSTGTTIEQKQSYLDMLAIGYYVVGALAGLLSCLALLYIGLGGVMAFNPRAFGPDEPPAFVGCMVLAMGLFGLTLGWAYAAAMIWAGRNLAARRRYRSVMVMAVVSCLFTPLGTALGILTLILLAQPEVKALFAGPAPAADAG